MELRHKGGTRCRNQLLHLKRALLVKAAQRDVAGFLNSIGRFCEIEVQIGVDSVERPDENRHRAPVHDAVVEGEGHDVAELRELLVLEAEDLEVRQVVRLNQQLHLMHVGIILAKLHLIYFGERVLLGLAFLVFEPLCLIFILNFGAEKRIDSIEVIYYLFGTGDIQIRTEEPANHDLVNMSNGQFYR